MTPRILEANRPSGRSRGPADFPPCCAGRRMVHKADTDGRREGNRIRDTAMSTRMTVTQAADYLGLEKSCIYRLCAARRIRHLRIGTGGGRILFEPADLDAYLASCAVEVGDPEARGDTPELKFIKLNPPTPRRRR